VGEFGDQTVDSSTKPNDSFYTSFGAREERLLDRPGPVRTRVVTLIPDRLFDDVSSGPPPRAIPAKLTIRSALKEFSQPLWTNDICIEFFAAYRKGSEESDRDHLKKYDEALNAPLSS
jgi:hypothetical protein